MNRKSCRLNQFREKLLELEKGRVKKFLYALLLFIQFAVSNAKWDAMHLRICRFIILMHHF